MDLRKEKLLKVLKEEYNRLPEFDGFGNNNYLEQYPIIFNYLENDIIPDDIPYDWHLLDAVINDFDLLYSDYCN